MPTEFQPPFVATDIIAGTLAVLAVLDVALWRRDREAGMGWFGAAFGLLALWIANSVRHLPLHPHYVRATWWFLPLDLGIALLCVGLVDYLRVPTPWRTRLLGLLLAPMVLAGALSVWVMDGALVPRNWLNVNITACFVGLAGVSFWAARREPGAGHGAVGLALLGIPALALVLALNGSPSVALRYWGYLPLMGLGLTLLTVSLLRRRRSLEAEIERRACAERALTELNDSLETQVERRTGELRDMVEGLESFNRSVSHDLRGPLGGIGGLARLAEEALRRGDPSTALRLLAPIAQQADTSARLVGALLALARTGDAELKPQSVDLQALAREVSVALLADMARAPAVEIRELPTVTGDPDLLRAVMTNLIGNALKFTAGRDDGRVEVDALAATDAVTVQVRDNGVGFDEADAVHLFEPFARLHGTQFSGHGVGLSIVRRAVERQGGQVQAAGRPGAGATFSFTLPQQAASAATARAPSR